MAYRQSRGLIPRVMTQTFILVMHLPLLLFTHWNHIKLFRVYPLNNTVFQILLVILLVSLLPIRLNHRRMLSSTHFFTKPHSLPSHPIHIHIEKRREHDDYYLGSISQQAALQALYHFGRQSRVKDQTLLLLFGEYLAAGSTPGAISLRKTKPR